MADLFRLVPFSVFIVVPFLEFTLPIFIKLFPGMLPTTFQTDQDQETKLKQSLKVKLEMAKFLQETLNSMCVARKSYTCENAKEFADFFAKVRQKGVVIPAEDILKFSKLFKDDITLDSLGRPQLVALCRVLDIRPIGTSNVLIWRIKLKLRSLAIDDKVIQKEGVNSLSLAELQQACKARGMRAYGLAEKRLRQQLTQWLDLSLNEKVPPSLLIMSSAFGFTENIPTSDLLVKAISSLPDSVGVSTEADLGERVGAIDNKAKLEATKMEKQKCEEERKERIEESKAGCGFTPSASCGKSNEVGDGRNGGVSTKDLKTLECAIENLDQKKLIVEKEEIKELKGELKCYQKVTHCTFYRKEEKVSESKAAKRLFKQVNNMITNMDLAVKELEEKEKTTINMTFVIHYIMTYDSELIKIDEIIGAVKKLQSVPDEHRLQKISQVLSKLDIDKDGSIPLDTVLKVLQLIGTENVKLSPKEMEMITQLVTKEKEMNDKTNDESKNK
ncbi:mitochondrial proton/calcium exchanger protein-like [Adelges cooleyi]|uniref:mitochondrial proton/calcium exchanger protein-like n=1 Tax=Adelges cooleyi TaxID=133065 RepID=UPI00217F4196|nr:mitochondrial proton/calcium exchanger protein-like [Adelges cooleyi]